MNELVLNDAETLYDVRYVRQFEALKKLADEIFQKICDGDRLILLEMFRKIRKSGERTYSQIVMRHALDGHDENQILEHYRRRLQMHLDVLDSSKNEMSEESQNELENLMRSTEIKSLEE